MKILDTQRLIFSFYLTNDNLYNEINQLHLKLLSRYINRFDESIFCIIVDDDINQETIKDLQKQILNMDIKSVMFKIYPNTNYRESYVLYEEIAKKLGDLDGLTFFAHNKGISDTFGEENIKTWIAALYFFSLETPLPSNALNGPIIYGPLKSVGCNYKFRFSIQNKFDWVYCGTFFWVKGQELNSYIKFWDREIPDLNSRWYSELFLGNLITANEAESYNNAYLDGQEMVGSRAVEIIEELYGDDVILCYFKDFCREFIF